jgi:membrane protein DedA with SNARE-associated domain
MTLIISLTLASALGTLMGNLVLFWVIGRMAQRQERKQLEEVQRIQQGYLELIQRERERLEKYAQMEG